MVGLLLRRCWAGAGTCARASGPVPPVTDGPSIRSALACPARRSCAHPRPQRTIGPRPSDPRARNLAEPVGARSVRRRSDEVASVKEPDQIRWSASRALRSRSGAHAAGAAGRTVARKLPAPRHGRCVEPGPLLPQAEAAVLVAPFADLMTDAPVVAFAKDAAGRYVYANPYLLASLGDRLGEDWYGKTDATIWPAEVAARVRTADRAVIRGGSLKAFSNTLPFTDGPHDLLILKFPLDSPGGVFLAGVGIDVTERESTRRERDRLAMVIEQVTESVMIADLDARITYVNPAFERISGYRATRSSGRTRGSSAAGPRRRRSTRRCGRR